ncbi:MAG TPA: GNAT family N-acetyltransferase [Ignavibacteriales bacterium]|nr:GNAT family N-acetyltransferase [Ignavibacteriales bacterium]
MNARINARVFDLFPVLESERLLFRPFHLNDAKFLYSLRSDEKVMEYMDTRRHATIEDSENLINFILSSYAEMKSVNWMIECKDTRELAGYFGFWRIVPEHCRGEIGYALSPKFWSRGIMTETLRRMIEFGFKDLHLHSIEANVNPKNESSIKLLERAGFQREAYFRENYLYDGKYYDSAIYSLLETDI